MSVKYCMKKPAPPPRGEIGPRVTHISKLLKGRFNEIAGEEGLFAGQHHIVLLLKHNPGLTVSRIAEALNITPATASVSIKRMEKAGFVKKKADKKDARITRIYLTERGEEIPDRIKEKLDFQEQFITRGFTDDEINLLSDMLDIAIKNLTEQEEERC